MGGFTEQNVFPPERKVTCVEKGYCVREQDLNIEPRPSEHWMTESFCSSELSSDFVFISFSCLGESTPHSAQGLFLEYCLGVDSGGAGVPVGTGLNLVYCVPT